MVLGSSYDQLRGILSKQVIKIYLQFLTIHEHLSIPSDAKNYSSTSAVEKEQDLDLYDCGEYDHC
jgi:hypothetical protein